MLHNVNGDQLKGIPKHKATVWGIYDIPTSVGNFSLRATYAYTGEYAQSGVDFDLDMLPSRRRLDLSASWADTTDKWNVRVFVDNVTDDDPLRSLSAGTESGNWRLTGSTLYPRFYGMDVKYRFNM